LRRKKAKGRNGTTSYEKQKKRGFKHVVGGLAVGGLLGRWQSSRAKKGVLKKDARRRGGGRTRELGRGEK